MTSIYFAGVMVRLMLVLAPVMCILSGIGISAIYLTFMKNIESEKQDKKIVKRFDNNYPYKSEVNFKIFIKKLFPLFIYFLLLSRLQLL
jgi:dolichyl-diphosphooligosaccharide--protein glycosyltransferase